jgi:hypothetical protein
MSAAGLRAIQRDPPWDCRVSNRRKLRSYAGLAYFVGVTPGPRADYNGNRNPVLTHYANNASAESFAPKPGVATRAAWSGVGYHSDNSRLSTRAESRLAPCMVRPNLFSGD